MPCLDGRMDGRNQPGLHPLYLRLKTPRLYDPRGNRPDRRLLTDPDLSSHAINQFLGIVADPGLEHRLDILDLVNAL